MCSHTWYDKHCCESHTLQPRFSVSNLNCQGLVVLTLEFSLAGLLFSVETGIAFGQNQWFGGWEKVCEKVFLYQCKKLKIDLWNSGNSGCTTQFLPTGTWKLACMGWQASIPDVFWPFCWGIDLRWVLRWGFGLQNGGGSSRHYLPCWLKLLGLDSLETNNMMVVKSFFVKLCHQINPGFLRGCLSACSVQSRGCHDRDDW